MRACLFASLGRLGEEELCSQDTDWRHALRLCVFLPGWGLAGSSIMAFSTADSSRGRHAACLFIHWVTSLQPCTCHILWCVHVCVSRQGLIGVKACLNGPVSAIGGNMGGCSRMSKLTTVDFSLIRFKFNSSHSYAVSFDLVYQLFIVSSVPD